MSDTPKPRRAILAFPILIALYPILHLYDVNVDQVAFREALMPMLESVAGVSILWLLIWLVRREPRRAAITASILVSLYYFYFLYNTWIVQIVLVILATNWLIVFLYRSESDFRGFIAALNVASAVAVGSAIFGIVSQLLNPPPMTFDSAVAELTEQQEQLAGSTPNFYYIVLDGYAGNDALKQFYRTDNQQFIDFLKGQGFWVGEHARSNYVRTIFSLSSALNLNYLDDFVEQNDLYATQDERPALAKMTNNKVRSLLEAFEYTTVGMSSGFTGWDMFGVQEFVDFKRSGSNEFRSIVNQQTPFFPIAAELAVMDPFESHRQLQVKVIDTIPEIPLEYEDRPLAGFVHIMCPHPPFVFERDGSPAPQKSPLFSLGDGDYIVGVTMNPVEYRTAYRSQLNHLNTMMREAISALRKNDPGAIIVVQGDHGPGSQYHGSDIYQNNFLERASILNAVYLPDEDYAEFYDTMTPVNTFRVILNRYFGTEYDLIPDRTFYSVVSRPYDFVEITFDDSAGN